MSQILDEAAKDDLSELMSIPKELAAARVAGVDSSEYTLKTFAVSYNRKVYVDLFGHLPKAIRCAIDQHGKTYYLIAVMAHPEVERYSNECYNRFFQSADGEVLVLNYHDVVFKHVDFEEAKAFHMPW